MLGLAMRTTITLEPDVAALVEKAMRERHLSFKDAVNSALRAGLSDPAQQTEFATPTFAMGGPRVDLSSALTVAGALEDDELLRKADVGK